MRSFFASSAIAALQVIVLPTVSAVGRVKESRDIVVTQGERDTGGGLVEQKTVIQVHVARCGKWLVFLYALTGRFRFVGGRINK